MFEIELIICIKIDLALNNLQRLICRKNNQPSNFIIVSLETLDLKFWKEALLYLGLFWLVPLFLKANVDCMSVQYINVYMYVYAHVYTYISVHKHVCVCVCVWI